MFYDVKLQRPENGAKLTIKYTVGVEMKGMTYDENDEFIVDPGLPCFVRFMEIRSNVALKYNYSLHMPYLGLDLLMTPNGYTPTQLAGSKTSSPDHSNLQLHHYQDVDKAADWSSGLAAWCSTISYQDNSTGIGPNHTHEWDPLPGHNATFTTCHFSPMLDEGGCPWKHPGISS